MDRAASIHTPQRRETPVALPVRVWTGEPARCGGLVRASVRRSGAADSPETARLHGRTRPRVVRLPDAPRPNPDEPAPPRFLPEFDNVLLSFDVRSRIVSDLHRRVLFSRNGIIAPTLLVDGFVRGTCVISRSTRGTVLTITLFERLAKRDRWRWKGGASPSCVHRRRARAIRRAVQWVASKFGCLSFKRRSKRSRRPTAGLSGGLLRLLDLHERLLRRQVSAGQRTRTDRASGDAVF